MREISLRVKGLCVRVRQGADPDSIRRGYRRLASKWHPDKHRGADYADAFMVNLRFLLL